MEENKGDTKKQNTSTKKGAKKKTPRSKSNKKGSRPAQETEPSTDLVHGEDSPVPALTQVVGALAGSAKTGLPSPMDIAQTGSGQIEVSQTGGPLREPPPSMEPAQRESPLHTQLQLPQVELPLPMEPPQVEPPPPMEPAQVGHCQKELPSPLDHAQMEVVQTEPLRTECVQKEPPPVMEPPLQVKPITKRSSPRKDRRSSKERLNTRSEMVRQEQVLLEVGLVPVRDSQLLKESKSAQGLPALSSPSPKGNSRKGETPMDQKIVSDAVGNKIAPLKKVGAEEAGESLAELAAPKESANVLPLEQNSSVPDGEILHAKCQTGSAGVCEMEVNPEQNTANSVPVKDATVESVSPLPLIPSVEREAVSPTVTLAENESQEIDEDEGIHSHDGSDLSDNMSEGSDDSGLHGARPVSQEASSKNGKEGLTVKVTEGDFVCIFCDRSFRKEKDYSKHLNRHLVNVYFLEKAAEGQE